MSEGSIEVLWRGYVDSLVLRQLILLPDLNPDLQRWHGNLILLIQHALHGDHHNVIDVFPDVGVVLPAEVCERLHAEGLRSWILVHRGLKKELEDVIAGLLLLEVFLVKGQTVSEGPDGGLLDLDVLLAGVQPLHDGQEDVGDLLWVDLFCCFLTYKKGTVTISWRDLNQVLADISKGFNRGLLDLDITVPGAFGEHRQNLIPLLPRELNRADDSNDV